MCDGKVSDSSKTEKASDDTLSLGDFFKLTPWDLRHKTKLPVIKIFKYVPDKFKEGPWKPGVTVPMMLLAFLVLYLAIDANIKYYASNNSNDGIMKEFVGDKSYPAFTVEWCYNSGTFLWMFYVMRTMWRDYKSFGPWVTYTVWSWTMMCVRHGLCAMAPFLPSLRLWIGIMRFPVLLSSTITFGVWNAVLMPVMVGMLKGERRKHFIKFAFGWRLLQIHIFNILYAYLNCVWAEPTNQGLHLGDVNAAVVYMITYASFYYLLLDRIGIQLYPIFSPRTYVCLPSLVMSVGLCVGNYYFWDKILTGNE
mmetsp:Transcript_860/g.1988  ORF Transcript_860/g.1988 Transcript_860/m.1988 type:complete len:308 (+) Transcript_860:85-1008(+)